MKLISFQDLALFSIRVKILVILQVILPYVLFGVTWTAGDDANWNDNANWDAAFPNAIDAVANFPNDVAADPTIVTLTGSVTVGTMIVASQTSREYSFTGSSISFDASDDSTALAFSDSTCTMSCGLFLTDTLSISVSGSGAIVDGTIAGAGGIIKSGTSTLTINNFAKTFAGATSVTAGTLALNADLSNSSISISSGATVSASGTRLINNLSGEGVLTGSSGTNTLTNTVATTFSGVIQQTLTRNVVKAGAESLTLSGTSSYTGSTTVSAGTLNVTGSIATSSSLIVNSGATLETITADFDTKLPGVRTFSNGSTVNVNLSSSQESSVQLIGSNAANLIKSGAATLTLSGQNAHTGTTTVSAGALVISGSISSSSSISIASGATLTFSPANANSFGNAISGAGAFTKTATGSTTLSGTCSYTGSTSVSAGSLIVTGDISPSSALTVSSGATVVTNDTSLANLPASVTIDAGGGLGFSISGTTTVSTDFLSGNRNFSKLGTGTLTLSATNTYTGTTTVSAGTLVVTGTVNSSSTTTVASGATLKGTGTIGPAVINGIMQPGTSIGTIEVVGNYTQSTGSTLTIEISPSATSKVNITGGSATIQSGATLEILPQAGSYTNITHVFLEADGGVTGTFDTITIDTTNFAGAVTHSINYTATQAQIILTGVLSATGGGAPLTGDTALLALTSDLSTRISRSQLGLITAVQDQRFLQNEICCFAPKDCFEETEEEDESTPDEESNAKRRACDGLEFAHPYVVFDYSRADINQRKNMLPGKDYLKAAIAGCDFRIFDDLVLGGAVNYTDGWVLPITKMAKSLPTATA